MKARHRDKIGTVNLKLIAAKGLPRVNENGSIDFNVSVRVFNSEGTAKPDFEYTTETIRSNDPLSRLLKAEVTCPVVLLTPPHQIASFPAWFGGYE